MVTVNMMVNWLSGCCAYNLKWCSEPTTRIPYCRCKQPIRADIIFDGESGNLTQIYVRFPEHKSEPQKVYDCSLVWAFTYQSRQHRFWGPVNLVQHWLFPAHNLWLSLSPSHNFPIISDMITTSQSLENLCVLVGFNKIFRHVIVGTIRLMMMIAWVWFHLRKWVC